jgi:hypothetical protein
MSGAGAVGEKRLLPTVIALPPDSNGAAAGRRARP